jgi:hypothetical protein
MKYWNMGAITLVIQFGKSPNSIKLVASYLDKAVL